MFIPVLVFALLSILSTSNCQLLESNHLDSQNRHQITLEKTELIHALKRHIFRRNYHHNSRSNRGASQPSDNTTAACIISPSGALSAKNVESLEKSIAFMASQFQWSVSEGEHVRSVWNAFAGSDEDRLADLQLSLEQCDIIFCARGGYGLARIIDGVNWEKVHSSRLTPLRVVGFSDITHLLLRVLKESEKHSNNLPWLAIHGPMPAFDNFLQQPLLERTIKLIEGKQVEPLKTQPSELNRGGKGSGTLIGGNLSILVANIGTASDFDTSGRILFIEEVGESFRRIDRMMRHLGRSGKLRGLAGLVIGQFSDCSQDSYFPDMSVESVVHQAVVDFFEEGDSYPVAYGFDIGHVENNFSLGLGLNATLVVDDNGGVLDIIPPPTQKF